MPGKIVQIEAWQIIFCWNVRLILVIVKQGYLKIRGEITIIDLSPTS